MHAGLRSIAPSAIEHTPDLAARFILLINRTHSIFLFSTFGRRPQGLKPSVFHCKTLLNCHLFNVLFCFCLVSYSLHYGFVYTYSCLVRIILSFNLCIFVSIHFSEKSVLIVVYKSLNVNIRCNRRYIG
jgi:hypothetical protein